MNFGSGRDPSDGLTKLLILKMKLRSSEVKTLGLVTLGAEGQSENRAMQSMGLSGKAVCESKTVYLTVR